MTCKWWARGVLMVGLLITMSVLVIGCGSSNSSSSDGESTASDTTTGSDSGSRGGTFTIGLADDTASLDPANCPTTIYCRPAYDALIQLTHDGKFEPSLATSWGYTDSGHKTFRVKLRKGLKFSDGSELTAQAVAASMISFSKVESVSTTNYFPIKTVKAADKYTVDIEYTEPVTYRYACEQISSNGTLGRIIGPAGLKDRKSLETESDGIGPYILDSSESTKGSSYTFVPNPDYYDQSAIRFDKVVMRVMLEPNSRFSAVQSGQIDWAQQVLDEDKSAAESAGLGISEGKPGSQPQMILANRVDGPLADLKVREALSYALPREEIAAAVYGESATPTSAIVFEDLEGFNAEATDLFPYDPERAKKLLAEAGYSDGFSVKLLTVGTFDPNSALSQALQAALAEVGVKVEVEAVSQLTTYSEKAYSKQYDTTIQNSGAVGFSTLLLSRIGPGSPADPWEIPVPQKVVKLAEAAALEPTPQAQEAKIREASLALSKEVLTLPIAEQPVIQVVSAEMTNVTPTYVTFQPDPFGEQWSLSG